MKEIRLGARLILAEKGVVQHGDEVLQKIMIGGVAISGEEIVPHKNFEGLMCEVIIRPIKSMGCPKQSGLRIDHAMQILDKEDKWKPIENSIMDLETSADKIRKSLFS